jgi:antitoxin MazE
MEIQVIRIGNSRGIRLSKTILDRYNINERVDLELRKNHIHIKSLSQPRTGWEKAFTEMNAKGNDNLLFK